MAGDRLIWTEWNTATTPGRHRLGRPGLNHCRELPAVCSRLDERSGRRPVGPRPDAGRRVAGRTPIDDKSNDRSSARHRASGHRSIAQAAVDRNADSRRDMDGGPGRQPEVAGGRPHHPRPTRRAVASAIAGRLTVVAMAVALTGAVVVSGWYTAAGASAIAQMVAP
jgi:hypothetical protein